MSDTEKTVEELEDILIKVAEVRHIDNYEISIDSTPSKTDGFLSELYKGEVRNSENGEVTRVAIKRVPKEAGIFADFADMYKNEDYFYSRIFPKLDEFQNEKLAPEILFHQIPKYFFGNLAPGKEHITMENIVTKGYRLIEKGSFFNQQHLDLVFRVFGKFHALSFSYKDQNPTEYRQLLTHVTDVFKNKDEKDVVYESIATNVLAGLKAIDPVQDKHVHEKLKKIEDVKKVLMTVNSYRGKYKCVIHGDSWSSNLLFKYGEMGHLEDVKLVDFQMIRESTPIHDLSFLFYCTASEEELPNLDSYLDIYYESFSNFARSLGSDPEKLYPFGELKREWLQYGLFGLFLGFDLLVLKLIKSEKALEMRNIEEINKEEGLKMWDDEMERIRNTEEFRARARAVILQAIQHGVL